VNDDDYVGADERQITPQELKEWFGTETPVQAMGVIFNSPAEWTVGMVRAEVRRIANRLQKQQTLLDVAVAAYAPALFSNDPHLSDSMKQNEIDIAKGQLAPVVDALFIYDNDPDVKGYLRTVITTLIQCDQDKDMGPEEKARKILNSIGMKAFGQT
jgi:hypothetical protein